MCQALCKILETQRRKGQRPQLKGAAGRGKVDSQLPQVWEKLYVTLGSEDTALSLQVKGNKGPFQGGPRETRVTQLKSPSVLPVKCCVGWSNQRGLHGGGRIKDLIWSSQARAELINSAREINRSDWPDRLKVLGEKAQVRAKGTRGWGSKMGLMYLGPQHGPGHFL